MKYELSPESRDFLEPVYLFPGDEHVPAADYRECIQAGYVSTAATLTGAAEGCGLDVDEETFERWKRVGATAGLLDDFLDRSPDLKEAHILYNQGLSVIREDTKANFQPPAWADHRLVPAVTLLANSAAGLPNSQRHNLFAAAAAISDIAILKAECRNSATYVDLLKQEALYTTWLVSQSASGQMRNQPGFDQFEAWLKRSAVPAVLINSLLDLRQDYRVGLTEVKPNTRNRLKLARHLGGSAIKLVTSSGMRRASFGSLHARRKYGLKSGLKTTYSKRFGA